MNVDALFFSEVLAVAVRRFSAKLLTAEQGARLRQAAAEFEAAYKEGQPATSVATKAPLPQVDSATAG